MANKRHKLLQLDWYRFKKRWAVYRIWRPGAPVGMDFAREGTVLLRVFSDLFLKSIVLKKNCLEKEVCVSIRQKLALSLIDTKHSGVFLVTDG